MYLYPSIAPGSVAMYTAMKMKSTKSMGIITLQAFSMPPETPKAMMSTETATAMIIHQALPMPNTPLSSMVPTAWPRVSVVGAVSLKRPTMLSMSWPIEKSSPVMLSLVYLNIQPMMTL